MARNRNAEGLTPAAAAALARASRRGRTWGVEARLREQLLAAGFATEHRHSTREVHVELTEAGRAARRVYRAAGFHRAPRPERVEMTPEQRRAYDEAAAMGAAAAVAGMGVVIFGW